MPFQPASAHDPVPDKDLQDAFKPVESSRDTPTYQTAASAKRDVLPLPSSTNTLAAPRRQVIHRPEKELVAVVADPLDPKIAWRLQGLADLLIDEYLDSLRCNPH